MLRFVSRSYLDSDDGACLVDAGSWVLRRLTSGLMFCDLRDLFLLSQCMARRRGHRAEDAEEGAKRQKKAER